MCRTDLKCVAFTGVLSLNTKKCSVTDEKGSHSSMNWFKAVYGHNLVVSFFRMEFFVSNSLAVCEIFMI